MTDKIEKLIEEENWKEARQAIEEALSKEPENHWYLTRLALTYYEEYDYKMALKYDEQALKLAPNCPLVLWGYAGALDMLGKTKQAITVYEKLTKRDLDSLAYRQCGEGLLRARGLVADCFYRLAKCYITLGNLQKAAKFFQQHIKLRKSKCESIYPVKIVKDELATLSVKNR